MITMMIVYKRDGREENFDKQKIINAIHKAFKSENTTDDINIAEIIANKIQNTNTNFTVEEIQNIVERELMDSSYKQIAKSYILYRDKRTNARKNTTDDILHEYLDGKNEYLKTENSNKNPFILNVQRDYMAGIISTDISRRYLLPKDVIEAHDKGIIHFHDIDYFAQKSMSNCSLINLKDMLENGTVINEVKIDPPHRFLTACTIATQIILGVTSLQYGGCSISLTHLAPFLRKSYKYYYDKYINRGFSEEDSCKYAKEDTLKELQDGVQTFNYQINSMTNSNGQSPFVSIFMYLSEDPEYTYEVSLIIEEFLKQRILGFKNKKNVYITPAFPKLLYVLEKNNIYEESKYWYLTKLAAKCTAKRMVPDYISEKKIKELKNGDCFPCMGCIDGEELVTYKIYDELYVESIARMWKRLSYLFYTKSQFTENNPNVYMDCKDVYVYDIKKEDFVEVHRIIRNISSEWVDIKLSSGRNLNCTSDHPLETINRGRVLAKDLKENDEILISNTQYSRIQGNQINKDMAWVLGLLLCGDTTEKKYPISFNAENKDDIVEKLVKILTNQNIVIETNEIQNKKGGKYKNVHIYSSLIIWRT